MLVISRKTCSSSISSISRVTIAYDVVIIITETKRYVNVTQRRKKAFLMATVYQGVGCVLIYAKISAPSMAENALCIIFCGARAPEDG